MRELKFRVWDNLFKEFKAFDNYFCKAKDGILSVCTNSDDVTVEQYTGLKDKNGKEICEGDIVRCGAYSGKPIVFEEGRYWLGEEPDDLFASSVHFSNIEVIGNVHENPELLGEEEEG